MLFEGWGVELGKNPWPPAGIRIGMLTETSHDFQVRSASSNISQANPGLGEINPGLGEINPGLGEINLLGFPYDLTWRNQPRAWGIHNGPLEVMMNLVTGVFVDGAQRIAREEKNQVPFLRGLE